MAPLIPGMENINVFGMFSSVLYYVKWFFYSVFIIGGMFIAYTLSTFNIKATVFPLYGSGKDGIFSVQKRKWNRVKWINKRTAWRALFPFMNSKDIEPFDSEYIYPGKQIYVYDLNGEWSPGRINISHTEDQIRSEIAQVPMYARNWQSLQHKKNAVEYAKTDFWSENKTLIMALMGAVAILAAGLIMVYMTYKMAGTGRADISALTSAIKGFGNIPVSEAIPK